MTVRVEYDEMPGWTDLRVPLSSTKLGGSKDPAYAKFRDDGAGSQGVFAWFFSDSSEDELYFETQLPHEWITGTELRPHLHLARVATAVSGTKVRFGLEYTVSNPVNAPGNTFGTTLFTGGTLTVGAAYEHQILQMTAISGADLRASAVLVGRLYRDVGHADDDWAAAVAALSFDIHYQQRGAGSLDEYPAVS